MALSCSSRSRCHRHSGSVLIQHGAEKWVGQIPPAYELLKTIDHVPRSLWAAARPAIEGLDREEAWRKKLAEFCRRVAAALDAMPQTGLPQAAVNRGENTLRTCLGLIDGYLAQGPPGQERLQHELRALTPALLADAAEAAKARLDAIDRDVRPWWEAHSWPERERTFVVVLGAKTSRPGSLAYTYFVNLLRRRRRRAPGGVCREHSSTRRAPTVYWRHC